MGFKSPLGVFCIKTTPLRIPGTAAEATREEAGHVSLDSRESVQEWSLLIADQITQSGAVR